MDLCNTFGKPPVRRREYQIPWNWSYSSWSCQVWVLGRKPGSSARISTLNYQTLSSPMIQDFLCYYKNFMKLTMGIQHLEQSESVPRPLSLVWFHVWGQICVVAVCVSCWERNLGLHTCMMGKHSTHWTVFSALSTTLAPKHDALRMNSFHQKSSLDKCQVPECAHYAQPLNVTSSGRCWQAFSGTWTCLVWATVHWFILSWWTVSSMVSSVVFSVCVASEHLV